MFPEQQLGIALDELVTIAGLGPERLLVVGCSTSEVQGRQIGKGGSEAVAAALWEALEAARRRHGFAIAIQCCEHLNRALVVERAWLRQERLQEVSAIPVPTAGGALAAHAWRRLAEPCLAEAVQADAGLDIGGTLIGMHLRRVAVPVHLSVRQVGEAILIAAKTRPPLVGGERAVYR